MVQSLALLVEITIFLISENLIADVAGSEAITNTVSGFFPVAAFVFKALRAVGVDFALGVASTLLFVPFAGGVVEAES